ncbi:hypothetical protein HDV57DRAFT_9093 [Trichoderma longibrachiatum]|uniref:Uncharacterized protein n=1 Tax=Trichoderma longibrachiatum ATCC 18648 TaxID=983965 RepID=A0A2T4CJG1_TRILO|nr:hypothetical protein M440DRAFT_90755 [Trichoderma longibrachiatum ATCC 18648]
MSKPQQQGSVTEYEYGSDEQSTNKHLVHTRIIVPSLSWGRGWILLPPDEYLVKERFPHALGLALFFFFFFSFFFPLFSAALFVSLVC